jgi:hypothetical protein
MCFSQKIDAYRISSQRGVTISSRETPAVKLFTSYTCSRDMTGVKNFLTQIRKVFSRKNASYNTVDLLATYTSGQATETGLLFWH